MTYEEKFKGCSEIKNDLDRANCLYGLLYELTRLQDEIQLKLPALNESVALSNSAINDANAIILECSKFRGDIEPIISYGYFEEKVNRLQTTLKCMKEDLKLSRELPIIFSGIRFDASKRKLVTIK